MHTYIKEKLMLLVVFLFAVFFAAVILIIPAKADLKVLKGKTIVTNTYCVTLEDAKKHAKEVIVAMLSGKTDKLDAFTHSAENTCVDGDTMAGIPPVHGELIRAVAVVTAGRVGVFIWEVKSLTGKSTGYVLMVGKRESV